MPLTLTNTFAAGGVITAADVNQNFTDIVTKFNANIIGADITDSSIQTTKLVSQFQFMTVRLSWRAGAFPAAGTLLDAVPIPGDSSDTNWVVRDAAWVCTDIGDGAGAFDLIWGYYDATPAIQTSTVVANAVALSAAAGADNENDAQFINSASTTLDFNHATGGNTPRFLGIRVDTQGAGVTSAANSFLSVSVTLRRAIQTT